MKRNVTKSNSMPNSSPTLLSQSSSSTLGAIPSPSNNSTATAAIASGLNNNIQNSNGSSLNRRRGTTTSTKHHRHHATFSLFQSPFTIFLIIVTTIMIGFGCLFLAYSMHNTNTRYRSIHNLIPGLQKNEIQHHQKHHHPEQEKQPHHHHDEQQRQHHLSHHHEHSQPLLRGHHEHHEHDKNDSGGENNSFVQIIHLEPEISHYHHNQPEVQQEQEQEQQQQRSLKNEHGHNNENTSIEEKHHHENNLNEIQDGHGREFETHQEKENEHGQEHEHETGREPKRDHEQEREKEQKSVRDHGHHRNGPYKYEDFYSKGDPQVAHINVSNAPPTELYPYSLDLVPDGYDVSSNYTVLGGYRFSEYTTGRSPYIINDDIIERSNVQARSRRAYVKRSMEYVWTNYVKFAFGMDELKPKSARGDNNWGGQGITLVDSLDTLWLMDMKKEFYQGRDWVRDHLDHSKVGSSSVFETTIRDLGGLLSAYDWSNETVFLEKALDLGERLLRSFDGSPTGIPFGQVNLNDGRAINGWTGNAVLAEFGTLQLEFKYLATALNNPQLSEKTDKVFDIMNSISPDYGLFPYFYNNLATDGVPVPANDRLTFGAMADSFYEYMLKLWIQTDKTIPLYREMYDKAMDGMHSILLRYSVPSGLKYIADKEVNGVYDDKMDHLVCFMGGLLALGAYTDPTGFDSPRATRDLQTAKALTYTCYQMYARMSTGISPEFVQFELGKDFQITSAPHYLLRPEAVESFFILNYLTKDPIYREWGWEVYQSIEKYCKTEYGYGAFGDVRDINRSPDDSMESFFIAETLKYLYLLQDPDTEVDILHKHVFNTEAHPFRIFSQMSPPITMKEVKVPNTEVQ